MLKEIKELVISECKFFTEPDLISRINKTRSHLHALAGAVTLFLFIMLTCEIDILHQQIIMSWFLCFALQVIRELYKGFGLFGKDPIEPDFRDARMGLYGAMIATPILYIIPTTNIYMLGASAFFAILLLIFLRIEKSSKK